MRTEDGYIIQQTLDGNSAAFGLLVDKYKRSIYALAYSEVRDFHDAQDITQEVFIKAYRKLHTLKSWDNFMGWLYRITHNLCTDWIRSKSRRPDLEFIEDQEPGVIDRSSVDSYREETTHEPIRRALNSLPEMYRQVLVLRYYGGMTVSEMSRFLGVSPRTIDRRLMRARERLRKGVLAMMSTAYKKNELPVNFTFRIVEMIKRIRVHPIPRILGLPWGLSLAAGLILVSISLNPHLNVIGPAVVPAGSSSPAEMKALKAGEVPVDTLKVSETPILTKDRGESETTEPVAPEKEFSAESQDASGVSESHEPAAEVSLLSSALTGREKPKVPPEKVALQAIIAMFVDMDENAAAQFFHESAQRKNQDEPALPSFREAIPELRQTRESITMKEIVFFREADIPYLRQRFADDMWDEDRIPARIRGAFGSVLVVEVNKPDSPAEIGLIALVFREIEGEYKIVYTDDN
jgi:RNA polymerase sigma factor (sigma-70 family)